MKKLTIIGLLLLSGCATPQATQTWTSEPTTATVSNKYFAADITPKCDAVRVDGWTINRGGCDAFRLTVVNKSSSNIEVNWNKTLYIANNQTSGGFMFEGVVYKDRNNPKSPDMVFPNGTLTKTVFPNNLVSFSGGQYGRGWEHAWLSAGEHGIYLSTIVDGKEINERLVVRLAPSQK